ncbi:MAG: DNA polymerase III subunit delta [Candidatus Melainabacteria bacterium]|nr:DNA polymerase III subunit delta [Candidatus Melainabacteria bacterium]
MTTLLFGVCIGGPEAEKRGSVESPTLMPVVLYHGEDMYRLRRAAERLRASVVAPEMVSLCHRVLRTPSLSALLEALGTRSLSFGYSSLLECWGLTLLSEKPAGAAEEKQVEFLKSLVEELPDDRHWLVVQPKLDKRLGFAKWLTGLSGTTVQEFKQLEPWKVEEAAQLLLQEAKYLKITLLPAAASQLVDIYGTDLQVLATEIQKLDAYTGGKPIEPVHVDTLSGRHHNLFQLLESWVAGAARGPLYGMLSEILHADHPQRVFATAQTFVDSRFHMKWLVTQGVPSARIAEVLKKHPYRVKIEMEALAGVPLERLRYLKDMLVRYDWQMKTGKIPGDTALEILLSC